MVLEQLNPVYLFRSSDSKTRVQYGLMLMFGSATVFLAFLGLEPEVQKTVVTLGFGVTSGLWLSHLVNVLTEEFNRGAK